METSKALLREIFKDDFTGDRDSAAFHTRFFTSVLTWPQLANIGKFMLAQQIVIGGNIIPAALHIPGNNSEQAPYVILAQLHGNEPAGLAGIALAIALSAAGKLKRNVIAAIGNPLAARQYFESYLANPDARQETRDAYRCGLSDTGALLPDMNRIPVDFLTRKPNDPHTKRAQELFALGQAASGILDLHTARGNMLCITDHKYDGELKNSPIRSILTGLADAISAHASGAVTVQTLKTILAPLPNIKSQVGIEAGRHEDLQAPHNAASFTLSLLHTLGLTNIEPIFMQENGIFNDYAVSPRMTYADLIHDDMLQADDSIYMAITYGKSLPPQCETVIVRQGDGSHHLQSRIEFEREPTGKPVYAIHQYDEMEAIARNQLVAVAIPSGTEFRAPSDFSTLFISKSAALYDKDPAVGPWPVPVNKSVTVKFCYPCTVKNKTIDFS